MKNKKKTDAESAERERQDAELLNAKLGDILKKANKDYVAPSLDPTQIRLNRRRNIFYGRPSKLE
jgi:hypothetical protein